MLYLASNTYFNSAFAILVFLQIFFSLTSSSYSTISLKEEMDSIAYKQKYLLEKK